MNCWALRANIAARNNMQRRIARVWQIGLLPLVLVVAAMLCSSCSGRKMTKSDSQGTWIPNRPSQAFLKTANSKCQIILLPDGTFNASVPDYLMKTSDQASGRIMVGTGQWSFLQEGPGKVKLNFTDVDGQRINWGAQALQVQAAGNDFNLFFWIGEEGERRFVFERQPTPAK